jgi:hypothetical protein
MLIVHFEKDYFICFRRILMDWRDVGIRISCQIKIKRERKRGGG